MIIGCGWPGYMPHIKSSMTIGRSQSGSVQRTTGLLTPSPEQAQKNTESSSRTTVGMLGLHRRATKSHLKCSCFNVSGFYKNLTNKMRFIHKHAWAPNTLKAISSQWKAFKEYCKLAGILTLPIEDRDICFFSVWLTSSGRVTTAGSLA